MTVINPIMNRTFRAIEPGFSVASYYFMSPRAVSYFFLGTSIFSLMMVWSVLGSRELMIINCGES